MKNKLYYYNLLYKYIIIIYIIYNVYKYIIIII